MHVLIANLAGEKWIRFGLEDELDWGIFDDKFDERGVWHDCDVRVVCAEKRYPLDKTPEEDLYAAQGKHVLVLNKGSVENGGTCLSEGANSLVK